MPNELQYNIRETIKDYLGAEETQLTCPISLDSLTKNEYFVMCIAKDENYEYRLDSMVSSTQARRLKNTLFSSPTQSILFKIRDNIWTMLACASAPDSDMNDEQLKQLQEWLYSSFSGEILTDPVVVFANDNSNLYEIINNDELDDFNKCLSSGHDKATQWGIVSHYLLKYFMQLYLKRCPSTATTIELTLHNQIRYLIASEKWEKLQVILENYEYEQYKDIVSFDLIPDETSRQIILKKSDCVDVDWIRLQGKNNVVESIETYFNHYKTTRAALRFTLTQADINALFKTAVTFIDEPNGIFIMNAFIPVFLKPKEQASFFHYNFKLLGKAIQNNCLHIAHQIIYVSPMRFR